MSRPGVRLPAGSPERRDSGAGARLAATSGRNARLEYPAPRSNGGSTSEVPCAVFASSWACVRVLASRTFGSSKGFSSSAAPATAVANSHRKNSAPRSRTEVEMRKTGCPARSRPRTSRRIHPRRQSTRLRTRDPPVLAARPTGSPTIGKHAAALLAGAFGHELFDPRCRAARTCPQEAASACPVLRRVLRHECAEARPGFVGRRHDTEWPCGPRSGRARRYPGPVSEAGTRPKATARNSGRRCPVG